MTMTKSELLDLAETGQDVCLGCGTPQPFAQETDPECVVCGCALVWPAEMVLLAAAFVREEGDD